MSNSPLVSFTSISPNRTSPRNHKIDTITIHCYVGQASVGGMGDWFKRKSAACSANYGIGRDGRVGLFVEEKDRSWCSSSRTNDNRAITIECACEPTYPYAVKPEVYETLIKLVADICKRNGIEKLIWSNDKNTRVNHLNGVNMTVHRDFAAKECPGQYLYERMPQIASEVNAILGVKWYRVRKSWKDEKSQLGAYQVLQNAKENCPVGYSVFDDTGKAIYTPVDAVSSANGKKYPSGVPASKEAYIEAVGGICRELQKETGILADVVAAQCILETGFGLAADCRALMEVNNLLGMKTDLINNTWKDWSVWKGQSITKRTPEYHNGQLVYINDSFRVYSDYENCIRDYTAGFLLHVRNSKGYKYACIRGMTDPAAVIRRIRVGTGTPEHPEGYCTDPNYETKILKLISDYNLDRFNIPSKTVAQVDRYEVGHVLGDPHRLGLFHDLSNAKKLADQTWGYKVFDTITKALIYEPKLSAMQKFVAEMVYMDALMKDDLKAGKKWKYRNKGTSKNSKTFDEARSKNNRFINCVSGVQWALIRSGVVPSDRKAIQWYGNKGIVWCNKNAEKDARKYFNIITVGKTVKQAVKDGTLQPGDVITYKTMAHTNAYIGNGLFFDTGHAYCSGSGEGAEFTSWTGGAKYNAYKIAQILRLR